MAKEVTHLVTFRDPFQHNFGPDRFVLVVACDDGAIYEFQKMSDSRMWSLRARGNKKKPRHRWTQSHAKLPKNVTQTLDEEVGKKKWTK